MFINFSLLEEGTGVNDNPVPGVTLFRVSKAFLLLVLLLIFVIPFDMYEVLELSFYLADIDDNYCYWVKSLLYKFVVVDEI